MDTFVGNEPKGSVVVHTHPLKVDQRDFLSFVPGKCLLNIIQESDYGFLLDAPEENLRIFCGDKRVLKSELPFCFPETEDIISIAVMARGGGGGGGGKDGMATFMSIALIAVAIAAPYLMPAGSMFAAGTLGGSLLSAGIMVGGSFLINAIAPTQMPKLGSLSGGPSSSNPAASPTYSLTGVSNRATPFGPIPRIMGTWHNYHPPLGAEVYTEQFGEDSFLRMLLVIGYGPVTPFNIKIGKTPLSEFAGVTYNIRTGLPTDGPLTIYTNDVHEEPLSILLTHYTPIIRTTEPDTEEISVDISCYQGVFSYLQNGTRSPSSVTFQIDYRPVGTLNDWTGMTGSSVNISENINSGFRRAYRDVVPKGQYDVRVTRLTEDSVSDRIYNKIAWVALRSIKHISPIRFDRLPPIATMELRIQSSEQLSGIVDQLNMSVTAHTDVWNGSGWVTQATSNPAWWYCDVLCGPAAKRPAARDVLDIPAMAAWAASCTENGLNFGAVIDTEHLIFDLLRDIASVGRASFAFRNNRYSINYEKPIENAVMLFSHRNSWNFEMSRDYEDFPHALRVQFNDEDANCQQSELIVYAEGYSEETAERYDSLEIWGITDSEQVAKQARFHLADLSLRPERYALTTWISFLRCTRGDRVMVSHPSILVGQCSGRILSVTKNGSLEATGITVDTGCIMETGKSYTVIFQNFDGSVLTAPVVTVAGESTILSFSSFIAEALSPEGGEHFSFGEASYVKEDCVITHIEPMGELTATITMRPYVEALYDIDSQTYESTVPVITQPPITAPTAPPAPSIISVLAGEGQAVVSSNGALQQTMWVTWSVPSGGAPIDQFEVQHRIVGQTTWVKMPPVNGDVRSSSFSVESAFSYDVRIRSISKVGVASIWVQSLNNAVDTTAPGRPVGLVAYRQLTQAKISWTNPDDTDLAYVEVWASINSTSLASASLVAMVPTTSPGEIVSYTHTPLASSSSYTYWVRAIDISRNRSEFFPAGAEAFVKVPAFTGSTINDTLTELMNESVYQTVFKVLADAFMVCKPGYPDKPIFSIGEVNGVTSLGLTGNAIIDGTILARMIAAGEVTADKIAAGAITADKIGAGEITAEKLSADIVFTPELAAGSVTAEMLNVQNLSAISSDLGAVTAGTLNMGSGKFVIDASGNATIKSALTGARLELSGGKIRVYDSSNVLRVEMGVLA